PFFIQSLFRRAKYITLVNLLAVKDPLGKREPADEQAEQQTERVLFPEFLTCEDKSRQIAAHIIRWLLDENHREGLVAELEKMKARIGHGGASRTAAEYILHELGRSPPATPRPHFRPGMVVASSGRTDLAAERK